MAGTRSADDYAEKASTYSASLFIIAVQWIRSASALCRAIDARLLKYVAMPAKIITGTPTAINAQGDWEADERINPDRCVMYAPDQGAEQVGI